MLVYACVCLCMLVYGLYLSADVNSVVVVALHCILQHISAAARTPASTRWKDKPLHTTV
jgi:hypothetical protein